MLATVLLVLLPHAVEPGGTGDPLAGLRRQAELAEDSPAAHFDLAKALELRGRWEEAVAEYEKTLSLSPEHRPAQRRLAQLLTEHGLCDRATSHWRAIQLANPNDSDAQLGLARCAMQTGEYSAALSRFRAAAETSPRNAAIQRGIGVCLLQSDSFEEAREAFKRAESLDPDDPSTVLALARLALGLGDPASAGPVIDRYSWLARNHKDGPANTLLLTAMMEALQHQAASAAEHLALHRKRYPGHAVETLYPLARLHYEAMRYDAASDLFQKLHKARPDDPEANYYLAVLAAREDREEAARSFMEKALEQGFSRPEAFLDNGFDPVRDTDWFKETVPPIPQTFYDPAPSPEEEEDEARENPDAAVQRERMWRGSDGWVETWVKEWALKSMDL